MTEADYEIALLLQHKLEQDDQNNSQSKFKNFTKTAYTSPKRTTSQSLADPSWEVIDPTPDVHALFISFNQRFFWNKLGSVTVGWSRRMTTCAGVCSYQGRGGLCKISLSEPLLKLRPRKDLVETLLHEMIHAYLFVTHNNRDRDGHGPEFHRHMYRINQEAGIHITVYHNFHDEVRLYKQHWWRCNGPCQRSPPFFGIVKRAMNRAPGPYDRWWSEHLKNCGGQFIKIKSPENNKIPKKTESNTNKNTTNDIRNYVGKKDSLTVDRFSNNATIVQDSITAGTPTSRNPSIKVPPLNNVQSFKDLSPSTSSSKGSLRTSSSTVVITKNRTETNSKISDNHVNNNRPVFTGIGKRLVDSTQAASTSSTSTINRNLKDTVRDHWSKKYDNSHQTGTKRSTNNSETTGNTIKKLHTDSKDVANCPVCEKPYEMKILNTHLDSCLLSSDKKLKTCLICGCQIKLEDFEQHKSWCFNNTFADETISNSQGSLRCMSCLNRFDSNSYYEHVKICSQSNVIDLCESDNDIEDIQCPTCKQFIDLNDIDEHINQCSNGKDKDNTLIPCFLCNKAIPKVDLNSHLEICAGITFIEDLNQFDDQEEKDDEETKKLNESRYNCPFCYDLFEGNEMQAHLDECFRKNEFSCYD